MMYTFKSKSTGSLHKTQLQLATEGLMQKHIAVFHTANKNQKFNIPLIGKDSSHMQGGFRGSVPKVNKHSSKECDKSILNHAKSLKIFMRKSN